MINRRRKKLPNKSCNVEAIFFKIKLNFNYDANILRLSWPIRIDLQNKQENRPKLNAKLRNLNFGEFGALSHFR
jgi:hypothetical protein